MADGLDLVLQGFRDAGSGIQAAGAGFAQGGRTALEASEVERQRERQAEADRIAAEERQRKAEAERVRNSRLDNLAIDIDAISEASTKEDFDRRKLTELSTPLVQESVRTGDPNILRSLDPFEALVSKRERDQEAERKRIADARNVSAKSKEKEGKPSEAEKSVDRAFAKDFSSFVLGGGAADAKKNIDQLKAVRERLLLVDDPENPSGENLTGPIIGFTDPETRSLLPGAQASVEVQQDVEEVIQRNLRLILGAQFTQKEGDSLVSRSFNPRLDEATNAKRLGRTISQMQAAMDAKIEAAEFFQKNGTMKGFQGKIIKDVKDIEGIEVEDPGDRVAPNIPDKPGVDTTNVEAGNDGVRVMTESSFKSQILDDPEVQKKFQARRAAWETRTGQAMPPELIQQIADAIARKNRIRVVPDSQAQPGGPQ